MAEPFLNVTNSLTAAAWVDRLDEQQTRIAQAMAQRSGMSEILAADQSPGAGWGSRRRPNTSTRRSAG